MKVRTLVISVAILAAAPAAQSQQPSVKDLATTCDTLLLLANAAAKENRVSDVKVYIAAADAIRRTTKEKCNEGFFPTVRASNGGGASSPFTGGGGGTGGGFTHSETNQIQVIIAELYSSSRANRQALSILEHALSNPSAVSPERVDELIGQILLMDPKARNNTDRLSEIFKRYLERSKRSAGTEVPIDIDILPQH